MNIKKLFENLSWGWYCGFAGGALATLASMIFAIVDNADSSFTWLAFALILAGGITGLCTLFTDFPFVPVVSAVLIAVGASKHLANGAYSLMNFALGPSFYGGNEWMVLIFFIIFLAAFVLMAIACYTSPKKN